MTRYRMKTWYWGNFQQSKSITTENGRKITLQKYEEEDHGWHNSEEFKRKRCFNSKLLQLAVELNTLDVEIIKTEFNKRYNDNLNSFDISEGLEKKYIVKEIDGVRFYKTTDLHNFSILDQIRGEDKWFKSGMNITDGQKEELITMLTKRCGQKVKGRIRSLITYDFNTLLESWFFERFYICGRNNNVHYNAGQCYPSELKYIRESIIKRFP